MKKHAVKVLLPLLFSFCFVFSGFLSVKVYAANVKTFDFSVDVHNPVIPESESYGSGSVVLTSTTDLNPSLVFDVILPYDVLDSVISDYFVFNLIAHDSSQDLSNVNFSVNAEFYSNTNTLVGTYTGTWSNWESRSVSARFTTQNRISRHINRVRFVCNWTGGQASRYENLMLNIYAVLTNADGTQSIIQAINNQTSILTDTIKDQFSGSPESSFNTNDIITQHNDKMGVLSFGSDVMIQFLDMFQNTNPGTAQLTLPGFAITVQNVKYQVWQDQTFNFNLLETWVPGLIDVIRIMLPAFVWLMILRYCIQVFERNFLSK